MATNPNGVKDRISEIRKMRLGDIADNSHNWRLHPERQRKALSKVYEQVGWAGVPLVYFSEREGGLTFVDGHLRKDESPDLTVRVAVMDLNDTEADILLSTYDPLGGLAEVDIGALAKLEKSIDIRLEDFWPVGELDTLLKGLNEDKEEKETEPQIDKAEELRKQYGVELGQVWRLGEHRLAIGDCTDKGVVKAVMGGVVIKNLLSDPPYGIKWNTDYTRFGGEYETSQRVKYKTIQSDDNSFDPRPYLGYEKVVLWGANWYCQHIPTGSWFVWDKRHPSGAAWLSDAEIAWSKGKQGVYIYSETVQGAHRKEKAFHPTQKPVGLFQWCIEKTEMGNIVYDPFLGSGTTMIACENLNRKCRGIEIDPGYAAVSVNRWEQHTGQKAELV